MVATAVIPWNTRVRISSIFIGSPPLFSCISSLGEGSDNSKVAIVQIFEPKKGPYCQDYSSPVL